MAHQAITPRDEDDYYEGEPLDIPVKITDDAGMALDITNMAISMIVKEGQTDRDEDALLVKSGGSVEYTAPLDGEAVIYVYEGDTDGFLDEEGGGRKSQDEFFVAVKADAITTLTADWKVHAN